MKRQIIGLALGLALLGAGSAQALVIDNFDTPQGPLILPIGGPDPVPSVLASPAGSVADGGGTRTLSFSSSDPGNGALLVIGGGMYILGANSTTITTVTSEWDIAGSVDLTDGGTSDFLIFGVDALDHPLVVTVTLTDSDGDVASNTYYKHNSPVPPDPAGLFCTGNPSCPSVIGPIFGDPSSLVFGNYYHGLAPFLGGGIDPATGDPFGGNPLITLTSITNIVFTLTTAGDGLDFTIDCVYTAGRSGTGTQTLTHQPGSITQTYPVFDPADGNRNACTVGQVPEPASLLLMGTGLLGVGLVGLRTRVMRRRQQQA